MTLITSLEQAGEGSRELDAEIGRAFGAQVVARFGDYDWRAEGIGIWRALPLFTRSMDDALALAERVLPGWGFYLRSDKDGHGAGLSYPDHNRVTPGHVEHKGSLPLALCLAILKATNPKGQPNV